MVQKLDYLKETPSQTAGPYVHIGLAPSAAGFDIFDNDFGPDLVTPDCAGERITVEGRVLDGFGAPLRDVLLELWQANAHGRYNHPEDAQNKPLDPGFRGWGRACSDFETGVWRFRTVKPGAVMGRSGRLMAPHLNLWIVARGINIGLSTRMYFPEEEKANAADPVLNLIEPAERRRTLISDRVEREGETVHVFDIRLQGEGETVFLDI